MQCTILANYRLYPFVLFADGEKVNKAEAYELHVDAVTSMITITGTDVPGVLHGVATLVSLTHGVDTLQEVHIVDFPRYEYRGERNISAGPVTGHIVM